MGNRASSHEMRAKATRAFVSDDEGATQWPRFQDLQITNEDGTPRDSVNSSESSRPERTDAPAAWKLNNCTLMVGHSVRFVAAAFSRKARSYADQTRSAN